MITKTQNSPTESRIATLKVQAPRMHIYPFSRLVNAPAGKWEKLITELEAKQKIVYLYYQPVREAIVKLTSKRGAGRDGIFKEMSSRAAEVTHSPSQNPVKDNQKAFECFEREFFPKISAFRSSLLKAPHSEGTFFDGMILTGLPHMIVSDKKGNDRYVYLYPSTWEDRELEAYLELLTIVIEAEFGADASDLWCMGLKNGKSIARPKSKARTRQSCRDAAKLFKRMVDAGVIPN
jgi:hypothetical protein